MILEYREQIQDPECSLTELLDSLITRISYLEYLREDEPEKLDDRKENIDELRNRIEAYEEEAPEPSLAGLIEELSLVAAIDAFEEEADTVSIMTLHSAKGLEFPIVFMAGMEDGLFPGYMSITSGKEEDIEEERRLCYVGITRAKEKLYMTYAMTRRIHGMQEANKPSRFLKELPEALLEKQEGPRRQMAMQRRSESMGAASNRAENGRMFVRQFRNESLEQQKQRMMGHPVMDVKKETLQNWKVGDRVSHRKFGLGVIEDVQPLNADCQVTVQFVKVGTKKLIAGLAGLKKQE